MSVKQLVVISGKGGTGKTSLVACFSQLADSVVIADCDVDASNLHLILHPSIVRREEFYSGFKAEIDPEKCQKCGLCKQVCRFEAVLEKLDANGLPQEYTIDPVTCDGCGVCAEFCPSQAITMLEQRAGEWYISETRAGILVHAQLGIGEENSGKLVSMVRKTAQELAEEKKKELILIDGPPGIGCPVIASLTGCDYALAVAEPSLSGIHDLKRVSELCQHFSIPLGVVINKYDLNLKISQEIQDYVQKIGAELLARLPYHPSFSRAMVEGKSLIEYESNSVGEEIKKIWEKIEINLKSKV